ncbi:ComEC/Rec2 family competence protein [Halocatena salina]|uniref:Metallo-beta-lactamase domain-containing protein n=1 Tax=Halocatena salina TaxID=2934340 RepID=A0A8U0A5H7_9EURY|nr:hypothetical protein [Halocatena salina]UPM43167.1 hypothetical protein MW046_01660 [Halocatena salina]
MTHIHDDHVDGVRVLKDTGYTIDQAYQPSAIRYETGKDGRVKRAVLGAYFEALSDHGIEPNEINQLTEGDPILEEEDTTLTALSPPATAKTVETTSQTSGHWCTLKPEKANGNGVVCKFEGPNGVSGLFMGDVGDESAHNAESWLVEQHDESDSDVDLNTNILFLGHHGSKNSTGEKFLNEVDPAHVVISSGLDNNYTSKNQYDGHPHDETLKRLHEREIDVHWTAVHGTVDTTVEEENITLDHDTTIETTDAADIAALKYYGQENDLDQEALAEIEEITRSELPEETPEWVNEVSLVTEQSTIDPEKIEELHELETERKDLKAEKYQLEETRDELHETKTDLEQEYETDTGLTERLTGAVGSLWDGKTTGDGMSQKDTTVDHREEEPDPTEDEGHDRPSTDADTHPSEAEADPQDGDAEQSDDIDATIAAYEQRNAVLRAEVTELTEQVEDLMAHVGTLEQEISSPGLLDRLTAAISSDTGDTQPTEIRRARFSETASSLADTDTETTTEETESTDQEHAKTTREKETTQEQAQPTAHTSDQTRSTSTHQEQDSSRDRSDESGFSL